MKWFSLSVVAIVCGFASQADAVTLRELVAPITRPVYHAGGAPLASDTPHRWYHNNDRVYPGYGGAFRTVSHGFMGSFSHLNSYGGFHGGCGCHAKSCAGIWDGYCGGKHRGHGCGHRDRGCGHHHGCGYHVQKSCGCKAVRSCGYKAPRSCGCKVERSRGCGHHISHHFGGLFNRSRGCGCGGHHDYHGYHGYHDYHGKVIEGDMPPVPSDGGNEPVNPPAPTPEASAAGFEIWPKALALFPAIRG